MNNLYSRQHGESECISSCMLIYQIHTQLETQTMNNKLLYTTISAALKPKMHNYDVQNSPYTTQNVGLAQGAYAFYTKESRETFLHDCTTRNNGNNKYYTRNTK